MTTSKTFSSFRSSSHRHRFRDDRKSSTTIRENSSRFSKRIDKRNIENVVVVVTREWIQRQQRGVFERKILEDVERKYNFYDDTYNKNDDYETKNKRNDFYRINRAMMILMRIILITIITITIRTFARRKRRRGKQSPIYRRIEEDWGSSSSSSSSSQKTMGSSSSSKRDYAARKIEGLVDAKAIQEREKMWARAAKGSGKKARRTSTGTCSVTAPRDKQQREEAQGQERLTTRGRRRKRKRRDL